MNKFPFWEIVPLPVALIDGTMNVYVNRIVMLPIEFPCGYLCTPEFFMTKLERTYPAVLSYSWLYQCNPTINWTMGTMTCQKATSIPQPLLVPLVWDTVTLDTTKPLSPLVQETSLLVELPLPKAPAVPETTQIEGQRSNKPFISLVSATTFQWAYRVKGAIAFQLSSRSSILTGQVANIYLDNPDLSNVSKEYWQFTNIFCKWKAKNLLIYQLYNLSIQIDKGTTSPLRPIYSLLLLELQILWEFIKENTKSSIIRPSNSPCSTPVLFVKKKYSTLHLCVNYWGLNHLTCKDRYPIPLITDLLDAPKRAWYYTTINLRSAYHLVHITKGNEWKTAFRTCYGSFKWLVMPFSLSNAPLAFQRFMNKVFSDLLDICVVVYLDDILV